MNLNELFSKHKFHPVIQLPPEYEIFDFSESYDPSRTLASEFGIGRYNEQRPTMYTTELFSQNNGERRDIHMGIDIAAPEGTPVYSFFDGKVFCVGINTAPGDYGGTLITEHELSELRIWVLHGHLSHASIKSLKPDQFFRKGELIARVGSQHENGGWNPHLHFQISLQAPSGCDLPGVVTKADLQKALEIFPDPRLILGPIY